MGVTAAVQPAAAPSKLPSAMLAKPRLELVRRDCGCGAPAGFSGRCDGCDRTGLTAPARAPSPDQRHATGAAAGAKHELGRFQIHPPAAAQTRMISATSADAAEREAEYLGARIAGMADPSPGPAAPMARIAPQTLYRRAAATPDADLPAGFAQYRGAGAPLAGAVRNFMEPRFGADFSHVRIHTDTAAAELSAAAGAQAFTYGQEIYFGRGQFQPETQYGRELIAHELTHTLQQNGSAPRLQRRAADTPPPAAPAATTDSRSYRMRDGRIVQLPDGMTAQDAARLEADAAAAKQRLHRRPPPALLPAVRKPAEQPPARKPPAAAKKLHAARQRATGPRTAGAKAKLSPIGDRLGQYLIGKATPVLKQGIAKLATLSRHEQTHDDAGQKTQQAQSAVVIPVSEGQSRSNSAEVVSIAAQPAPDTSSGKAAQRLQASLAENVPQTIDDVDHFKPDMKAQHTGADILTVVTADTAAVTATFAGMTQTPPPAPPEQDPVALPPVEAAPATGALQLGRNAVPQLLPEHTDVSKYTKDADARLQQEGITQAQLEMVDSGDLAEANTEKKSLAKTAKIAPPAMQGFAREAGRQVEQALQHEEGSERGALHAKHKSSLGHARENQHQAKSALERKRETVASRINGIFETAQQRVKQQLAELETTSLKRFDDGNAAAAKAFEDHVHIELEAYKDDRYSGVFGDLKRAKDWLLGMDDLPGVKSIFDRNKSVFEQRITDLLAAITADNQRVVQDCQETLARARADIQSYRDTLEPGLQDIADRTAKEVGGKLDDLDGFIREKETALQAKLADKQQAAIQAIDDKIDKMQQDMSGAVSRLGNLLVKAAKKFFSWALEKFGYSLADIEAYIDKGVAVLKAIFTQPIQFVKNLVGAAIQGFKNFGKNFSTHLKDSVFDWLTGALDGIVLPATWDLKGIAGVALQIIGISWPNIRGKLVKATSETAVQGLENGFDLVVTLVRDGPMAAWEKLQEMAGDIKQAFIEGVKDFISGKVVQEALKLILGLFVPGAGVVRAIIGIYDTVMFFIQKARDIIEMVGSFLGSIGQIAAGNIGAAALALENGLARGLTLVINFLAKFLRLDGITAKIRNAIEKLRGKVDNALDKVVAWIVGKAKGQLGKAKTAVAGIFGWEDAKARFAEGDGETHTISVEEAHGVPVLIIASYPERAEKFVDNFIRRQRRTSPDFEQRNAAKIRAIGTAIEESETAMEKVEAAKKAGKEDGEIRGLHTDLKVRNAALAGKIAKFTDTGGDDRPNEGKAERYGAMPSEVRDAMTPDHEPQNALMEYVRDLSVPKFRKIFAGPESRMRSYSMSAGICMNMAEERHKLTRTYKGSGSATKNRAISLIETQLAALPAKAEPKDARKAVGKVVTQELQEDQDVITAIYNQPGISPATKNNVAKGKANVREMNRRAWPDLFT